MQGPGTYHYMLSRGGEEEKENRDRDGGKGKQLGDELVLLLLLLLHTEARINVTLHVTLTGQESIYLAVDDSRAWTVITNETENYK